VFREGSRWFSAFFFPAINLRPNEYCAAVGLR
jgi:hypothetical protein